MRLLAVAICTALLYVVGADHDHSAHDHSAMDEDAGSGSDSDSGSHDDGSHAASERDMKNMPECVMNPKKASCSSYEYPEDMARDDIASLCDAMPYMIACGLWEACEAGDLPDSPYCHPFTVLATGCNDEGMSGMEGCAGYNAMCVDGTRVAQCRERRPVPSMLQTTETQICTEAPTMQEMIVRSCSDHSMPGCDECTSTGSGCPQTLRTAATVCHAHDMDHCAMFDEMCAASGDGLQAFCDPTSGAVQYDPPMRMYFHTGIRDMVLFRRLVPENDGQYAGVILAVLLVGMLATALRLTRNTWEALERMRQSKVVREMPDVVAEQSLLRLPRAALGPHVGRTALSFAVIFLDYTLMLIAMTFNVGLFFAVCIGLALGLLLFVPMSQRYLQRAQARELQTARKCECANAANLEAKHLDGMKEAPEASAGCGAGSMCCDTHTALDLQEASATTNDPVPSCCK